MNWVPSLPRLQCWCKEWNPTNFQVEGCLTDVAMKVSIHPLPEPLILYRAAVVLEPSGERQITLWTGRQSVTRRIEINNHSHLHSHRHWVEPQLRWQINQYGLNASVLYPHAVSGHYFISIDVAPFHSASRDLSKVPLRFSSFYHELIVIWLGQSLVACLIKNRASFRCKMQWTMCGKFEWRKVWQTDHKPKSVGW